MATDSKTTETFDVVVVTPDKVILEDKATRLMAPGIDQEFAILPDHTPLYAEIVKGDIVVDLKGGKVQTIPVESGIIRVKQNKASVILGFRE